jgi:hypothetical protein
VVGRSILPGAKGAELSVEIGGLILTEEWESQGLSKRMTEVEINPGKWVGQNKALEAGTICPKQ